MKLMLAGIVVSASSGGTSAALAASTDARATVRIAHLVADDYDDFSSLPVHFMLQKLATENRTILPDFDIIVDALPHARYPHPDGDGAGNRVIQALLAEQPYHAIVGPFSKTDCLETVELTASGRVLHVVKGENAEFSYRRDRYPYVFRTFRSIDGIIHSWMYIAARNSWRAVVSVWVESSTLDLANMWASSYNISNIALLAEEGADWIVEAWQSAVIDQLRQRRIRVVMTYLWQERDMAVLACRIESASLSGIQYFASGIYILGWHLDPSVSDCTPEDMSSAVAGYITALHTFWAPGLRIGALELPITDGVDQSALPLTCVPGYSSTDWLLSGELLTLALETGITDPRVLEQFLANSGSEADMVCAVLLALHDAIYNKGIELGSLEQRTVEAFSAVTASMDKVDFQGPTGRFRFYDDSGDPEVIYYMLSQLALPGAQVDSPLAAIVGTITYPDGPSAPPTIEILDENRPLVWRDGSTGLGPKPHLGVFPDCSTMNAVLVRDSCVPCHPGKAFDVLLETCRTCAPGFYQTDVGASACSTSLPGSFVANVSSPTAATPCPAGSECPQVGMVLPVPCHPGTFAPVTGLASCRLCPAGSFQDDIGSTECRSCETVLVGSTTVNIASTSSAACLCPAGTYRSSMEGRCLGCPEGMLCPIGSRMWESSEDLYRASEMVDFIYPQVQEGYMTLAENPMRVYLCTSPQLCPGGLPGTCASNRDRAAVACGECQDGAFERGEDCMPCGDIGALPLVAALSISLVLLVVITFVINKDLHRTPASSITMAGVTVILFMSLQTVSLLNSLETPPWKDPVKAILSLTDYVNFFDLRLLQASCTLGSDPLQSFAVQQLLPILALPVIVGALWTKNLLAKMRHEHQRARTHLTFSKAVNAIGTLYCVFFIAIVISALKPFICYQHPGSSGQSMRSASSLLCFEADKHAAMIVISVIAFICIPVPLMTLCAYGVYMYPRKIDAFDNSTFMHAFRFLFFRYRPQRYYFQCILLARSLLLCLVPAVLHGTAATQVLCMTMVLSGYSVCVSQLQAWRTSRCNLLDASMNALLSVILTSAGLFLDDDPHKDAVNVLMAGTLLVLPVMAFATIGITLQRRIHPQPYYDFFICHHKQHAAAQARLLKMVLQSKKVSLHVFIDSDDLKELDSLFDTVKSCVRNMVVYLTAETLKRAWCTGEVVSAVKMKLCILAVHTPSFVKPTWEVVEELEEYVDTFGCNLKEYNIQWENVAECYHHLLHMVAPITMSDAALGTRRFELVVSQILGKRTSEQATARLDEVPSLMVALVTDSSSDEANAAAGILQALIRKDVFQAIDHDCVLLADYAHTLDELREWARTAAMVMFLSAGCLMVEEFLSVLCEAQLRESLAPVVLVNLPDFKFPSPRFRKALANDAAPDVLATYGADAVPLLVNDFFKTISVQLPTHASQQALETQSTEVLNRLKQGCQGRSCSVPRGSRVSSSKDSSGSEVPSCVASSAPVELEKDEVPLEKNDADVDFTRINTVASAEGAAATTQLQSIEVNEVLTILDV